LTENISFKTLFLATRPMFVPASILPVLIGTAWGCRGSGHLDFGSFAAALVGMVCMHGGANVLNDVGDDLNGCDLINLDRIAPFTGGSRAIQDGILTRRQMTVLGTGLLACADLIGLVLTAAKGAAVLWFGLIGGGLAIAYSLPPFSLASRGLGEAAVAVAFTLPVCACAWLQSGRFDDGTIFAALALGGWSACILIVNEIPDRLADSLSNKRTLVVRLEPGTVRPLYLGVLGVAALSADLAALSSDGALWTYLPPVLLLLIGATLPIRCGNDRKQTIMSIRATLGIHLAGGLWLTALAFVV